MLLKYDVEWIIKDRSRYGQILTSIGQLRGDRVSDCAAEEVSFIERLTFWGTWVITDAITHDTPSVHVRGKATEVGHGRQDDTATAAVHEGSPAENTGYEEKR